MRIAQRIARSGLCSRRQAERWIANGRIALDGALVQKPAINVDPGDLITIDGHPLGTAGPARLWRYHKPAGLLTTRCDERGRSTIFEQLPSRHLMTVGRLDLNSEGLLLLTDDGLLARELELPANRWQRRYRVRVYGRMDRLGEQLALLANGVTVGGIRYGKIEAHLDSRFEIAGSRRRNAWLTVNLYEGKNRTIRRVMSSLGLSVNRLIRVGFGSFSLSGLPLGKYQVVAMDRLIAGEK